MISIYKINRAGIRRILLFFFFSISISPSIFGQSKIVISQFKNSHFKDITILYKKIKNCNTLDCAYKNLEIYFIEANGDFFELKCIKGCTPPLVMQFGKISMPEKKVIEKQGLNTTQNLKTPLTKQFNSVVFLVEDTYIDTSKNKYKNNDQNLMTRIFQENLSKGYSAILKSSLIESGNKLPDDSLWKTSEYYEEKQKYLAALMEKSNKLRADSLWKTSEYFKKEQKYLAVVKPLSYQEKTKGKVFGLAEVGELNYALNIIDLETGVVSATDTFFTQKEKLVKANPAFGILNKIDKTSGLKYQISEISKNTVLIYLDSLLGSNDPNYFEYDYLTIQRSELQFDKLNIEVDTLINELQNIQPIISAKKTDNNTFSVDYYCNNLCLIEFIKQSTFANSYTIAQKNNKIILTLNE